MGGRGTVDVNEENEAMRVDEQNREKQERARSHDGRQWAMGYGQCAMGGAK